ncbi:hypothetical protein P4O66_012420 [Electrophorus voltai]|uniref:Uncharacterized protein n=1 Tax=Electrophorus voltai TaxID=2609070 RepID=A0AAD9DTD1_9TELE|nr:hypothetical protein P4O66_012420 [Electrophorus voltai]
MNTTNASLNVCTRLPCRGCQLHADTDPPDQTDSQSPRFKAQYIKTDEAEAIKARASSARTHDSRRRPDPGGRQKSRFRRRSYPSSVAGVNPRVQPGSNLVAPSAHSEARGTPSGSHVTDHVTEQLLTLACTARSGLSHQGWVWPWGGEGFEQIFLNANSIRLGGLPHGSVDPLLTPGTSYTKQTVYEVCACPSGKLYLSPAESASTCQTTNSVCLWS